MLPNSDQLKKRIIKGLGANAYGQLVTIGIQLLSVPLFLHYWGAQKYGEWLILVAMPAYLSLSDIGFAIVAGNQMSMEVAKGDKDSALKTYQSSWFLISAISMLTFMLVCIVLNYLPVAKIFKLQTLGQQEAKLILLFLCMQVLVSLQGGMVSAGFRAVGQYAKGTFFTNSIRLFEWLCSVVTLILFDDAVLVSFALLIGRIASTLLSMYSMKKSAPWLVIGKKYVSGDVIKKLMTPASALMVFSFGLAVNIQGMILVVGNIFGPSAVVMFSTYRTFSRLLVQAVTLVTQALWPEISNAYGIGDLNLVRKLHRKGFFISFWLGILAVIVLSMWGTELIGLWTRNTFSENRIFFLILLTAALLNMWWQSSWVVLMAINKHGSISSLYIYCTILTVAAMILFGKSLSIEQFACFLIIAEMPLLFYAISKAVSFTNDSPCQFLSVICKKI